VERGDGDARGWGLGWVSRLEVLVRDDVKEGCSGGGE